MKFVLLILLLFSHTIHAQVPRKVIVEHFTNTRCSVCAFRNPGFFSNLQNNPNVVRLTIHPSSPYPNCLLNQHNVSGNDARTNFYNIYGGTPRLVVQGTVLQASADYASPSIFTPHQNQTTPIDLTIRISNLGMDSIRVNLTIKNTVNNTLGNQNLFLAMVEDSLFYQAPNGESLHRNVYRTNVVPFQSVQIPAGVSDSINLVFSVFKNTVWNSNQMFAMAIIQNPITKAIEQVGTSAKLSQNATSTQNLDKNSFKIFPNPASNFLNIEARNTSVTALKLIDLNGKALANSTFQSYTRINLEGLSNGIYLIQFSNEDGIWVEKVVVGKR